MLSGLFDALFYRASTALAPDVVAIQHLTSSKLLNRFSGTLANPLAGPLVGGAIDATIGVSWSPMIDAATLVVSGGCLLIMHVTPWPSASGATMLGDIRAGPAYCRRTPWSIWSIAVAGGSRHM